VSEWSSRTEEDRREDGICILRESVLVFVWTWIVVSSLFLRWILELSWRYIFIFLCSWTDIWRIHPYPSLHCIALHGWERGCSFLLSIPFICVHLITITITGTQHNATTVSIHPNIIMIGSQSFSSMKWLLRSSIFPFITSSPNSLTSSHSHLHLHTLFHR